jgi:hypothetical protein
MGLLAYDQIDHLDRSNMAAGTLNASHDRTLQSAASDAADGMDKT